MDLTLLFSHFYSVNSNSDHLNSPLTPTKFPLPRSKFTQIYPQNSNSSSCNSTRMPTYYNSSSCCIIVKNTKTITTATWIAFHFPSEFGLKGFYCTFLLSWTEPPSSRIQISLRPHIFRSLFMMPFKTHFNNSVILCNTIQLWLW